MYAFILALHSLVRWFVLASLLVAIFRGYQGWMGQKTFSKLDNTLRHSTATIVHIQFILGISLYAMSPIVHHFWHHFQTALRQREARFFGMEHITMMLIGITVITIGSAKAKRRQLDKDKFKTMAIWFTIGLLIIITSIPWKFSPLVSRPDFRPF